MKESPSFCSHQMVFSKWSKNTFLSYLEVSKNSQDFELKNHVMCLYTTVWRALDSSHRKNSPMPHFCSVWLHTFFQCYHASQQAIENTIMVTSEFFLYNFYLTLLYFLELGEERNMVLCLQNLELTPPPFILLKMQWLSFVVLKTANFQRNETANLNRLKKLQVSVTISISK